MTLALDFQGHARQIGLPIYDFLSVFNVWPNSGPLRERFLHNLTLNFQGHSRLNLMVWLNSTCMTSYHCLLRVAICLSPDSHRLVVQTLKHFPYLLLLGREGSRQKWRLVNIFRDILLTDRQTDRQTQECTRHATTRPSRADPKWLQFPSSCHGFSQFQLPLVQWHIHCQVSHFKWAELGKVPWLHGVSASARLM